MTIVATSQRLTAQPVRSRRQFLTVVIGESEVPATHLPPQEPILFNEVGQHLPLPPVRPAGDREQQHLKRRDVDHMRELTSHQRSSIATRVGRDVGHYGPAVWIRAFADADGRALPGTEGARWVFWSSDSQSIGFTSNHQIHRQSIQGGAPRIVARFSGQFIGAARSGDTIVFASFPGGLMRVPVDGGTPAALTNLRTGDQLHGAPAFLPGGRRVLFPAYTDSSLQICTVSLDDPAVQCAETVASLVAYGDRRRLLMLRDGLLAFHPFDVDALRSEGEPTAALDERILLRAASNRAAVSYSPPGVIAFRPGSPEQRRPVWFDRAGRRGTTVAVGSHDNFDLASDGTRILVAGTDDAGNDRVSGGAGDRRRAVDAIRLHVRSIWHPDHSCEVATVRWKTTELSSKLPQAIIYKGTFLTRS